jgi:uncharacterized protein DUF4255
MSTALAIAGVSALLRDLLNNGVIDHDVTALTGSQVSVTTLPPDRIDTQNGTEATQLNLFLRHVTPNLGWRNEALPSRDSSGRRRLSNAPLALDLHYLVSAHGAGELHTEILLGYAMQLLHEHPILTREDIRRALIPSPDVGLELPPALRALSESGLEHQLEQLRITPEFLNTEEISKFWTATLAHFRPCVAYQVSVVLIEATTPTRTPLPVLKRQLQVRPELVPPVPTLDAVVPSGNQPVVELGKLVALNGHDLGSTGQRVQLLNDRLGIELVLSAPDVLITSNEQRIDFRIPVAAEGGLPAGLYRVSAHVPAGSNVRESNQLALTLAPTLTSLPASVTRDGTGTASFGIDFRPALAPGQIARLLLGQRELVPEDFSDPPVTHLGFVVEDAPVGQHLVRLRIDGIDTPIIDRSQEPPVFFDQRIEIV